MLIIDILDVIGGFWGDAVTARSVARALAEDPDAEDITVRINSPGGDVFEGTAIYNMLRGHGASIRVEVHGLAASMGSVIAMAGDEIVMAEGAMMMIHNPWALSIGDAAEMRKNAEFLDKVRSSLLNIYHARSGVEKKTLTKMMDDETWLTADEAVDAGLAHLSTALSDASVSEEASGRVFAMLHQFSQPPSAVLNRYHNPHGVSLVAAHTGAKRQRKQGMDRNAILALLGLPKDAADDAIRERVTDLSTPDLKDFVPRSDYDAQVRALQTLKARHEQDEKDRLEADAKAAVDTACAEGKITPAAKDYHLKVASKSREALTDFQELVKSLTPVISAKQSKKLDERDATESADAPIEGDAEEVKRQLGLSDEEFAAMHKKVQTEGTRAVYGA